MLEHASHSTLSKLQALRQPTWLCCRTPAAAAWVYALQWLCTGCILQWSVDGVRVCMYGGYLALPGPFVSLLALLSKTDTCCTRGRHCAACFCCVCAWGSAASQVTLFFCVAATAIACCALQNLACNCADLCNIVAPYLGVCHTHCLCNHYRMCHSCRLHVTCGTNVAQ